MSWKLSTVEQASAATPAERCAYLNGQPTRLLVDFLQGFPLRVNKGYNNKHSHCCFENRGLYMFGSSTVA
ncbi:UNVERIFIED_CONTAM: hypothetical protein K2H54_045372 [Gekko kuhli]